MPDTGYDTGFAWVVLRRENCYNNNLEHTMLASYMDKALEKAVYEIIEDEGTYWGELPGLQGVWARHKTLEGCRLELREALSDWLALRFRLGLPIPILSDIDLSK